MDPLFSLGLGRPGADPRIWGCASESVPGLGDAWWGRGPGALGVLSKIMEILGSVPGVLGCWMGSGPGALAVFRIGVCVSGDAWWGQCLEVFGVFSGASAWSFGNV